MFAQIGASVRSNCSMWRQTISLVALRGAHAGVLFESGEHRSRGAAVHDPIEGGASARQPAVEPSNNLHPAALADLRLGTFRPRGTEACNDLSRLYGRRTKAPLQVHLVLCGHEAPSTPQQREYHKR